MQMGACGEAAFSHYSDAIPRFYIISVVNINYITMAVEALPAPAVVDLDMPAVALIVARIGDGTVGKGSTAVPALAAKSVP